MPARVGEVVEVVALEPLPVVVVVVPVLAISELWSVLPDESVAKAASRLKLLWYSLKLLPNRALVLPWAFEDAVLWALVAVDSAAEMLFAAPAEVPMLCWKFVRLAAFSPVNWTNALVAPVYSFDAARLFETLKLEVDPRVIPLLVPVLLL